MMIMSVGPMCGSDAIKLRGTRGGPKELWLHGLRR
jgi:hypothetical protein